MSDATSPPALAPLPSSDAPTVRQRLWQAALPIALIALLLGFSAVDARVLSPANLLNVVQQTSYLALFAMAQTVVILTRGFDLSLGPTVSMVSVASAMALAAAAGAGLSPVAVCFSALLAGLSIGLAAGAFNGLVVALLGVSPFVATLGSYNIAIGVATTISGGRPVPGRAGPVLRPPLSRQRVRRAGDDRDRAPRRAASASGPDPHRVRALALSRRHQSARGRRRRPAGPARARSGLSPVLAARGPRGADDDGAHGLRRAQSRRLAFAPGDRGGVVGGTSLAGGRGGVGTAVLGALFVTILSNGMNLARIDGYVQMVVLGAIVIVGVVLDRGRLSGR